MPRDPRVDAYIAASAPFAQPILAWLRDRVHAAVPAADEAIKWSRPAFLLNGRLLAGMAAFTAHATFGFWHRAAVVTGLEGQAMGHLGRIAALSDLPDGDAFEALIRTVAAAEVPRRRATPSTKPAPDVPPAFASALSGDAVAQATFAGLPTSARRDYCEWIEEARRAETRDRRVALAVAWLRKGKRRNWKYETG